MRYNKAMFYEKCGIGYKTHAHENLQHCKANELKGAFSKFVELPRVRRLIDSIDLSH